MMVTLGACQTAFQGEAQFPGGPEGCFDHCAKHNMDMASFVYVGEYSSACACSPRASGAVSASDSAHVEGAVVASAVGVELQRRQAENRNAQLNQPGNLYGAP